MRARRLVPLAGLLLALLPACPGPAPTAVASSGPEGAVTTARSPGTRPAATASPARQNGPGATPTPGGPGATPTPPGSGFATPTPAAAGPGAVGFTLTFSAGAGDNADRSGYAASETTGTWTAAVGEPPLDALAIVGVQQAKKKRTFTLTVHQKPTTGKTYAVADNDRIPDGATLRYAEYETFVTWAWRSKAGKLETTAVQGNRVAFKLIGVEMAPEPGTTTAKGTFTVDGTATADVAGLQ